MVNLKRIRLERGLSQFQLTMKTGIEQCRISEYEQGHKNINCARIETICKLAKVLDVKAWEILEGFAATEILKNASDCEEYEHDTWFEGGRLEETRRRMKMTQKEFSEYSCFTRPQIVKWENHGLETVRIETLAGLCIYLDCHPCDLIDDPYLRKLLRGVL